MAFRVPTPGAHPFGSVALLLPVRWALRGYLHVTQASRQLLQTLTEEELVTQRLDPQGLGTEAHRHEKPSERLPQTRFHHFQTLGARVHDGQEQLRQTTC